MSSHSPISPSEPKPAGSPCVLLIDDENAVRLALKRYFARRGWAVTEAVDGASARSFLDPKSDRAFDVVICDLNMPRESGRDLYRWLVHYRPDAVARLVFSSGDTISPDASAFLMETGRPVLPKPFELAELSRIVEDVTRTAHAA